MKIYTTIIYITAMRQWYKAKDNKLMVSNKLEVNDENVVNTRKNNDKISMEIISRDKAIEYLKLSIKVAVIKSGFERNVIKKNKDDNNDVTDQVNGLANKFGDVILKEFMEMLNPLKL